MADETSVGSIKYDLNLDTTQFDAKSGATSAKVKSFGNQFQAVGDQVKGLAAAFGLYFTASAAIGFFKSSVDAFLENQRVIAQTGAVLISTGDASRYSTDEIIKMSEAIQKQTPIAHDAAEAGMNMLLTYTKIGHDTFPQATQTMLDMATAMNGGVTPKAQELIDVARQLGFAMNDPVAGMTRLRRAGVNLSETQKEQIQHFIDTNQLTKAQGALLDALATKFGGSAKAQMQTFGGQMDSLHNSFIDTQEAVGHALVPALLFLFQSFQGAAGGVNFLLGALRVLSGAFIGLITLCQELGMVISAVLSTGIALVTGQASAIGNIWGNTAGDMLNTAAKAQESITQVWSDETNKQTNLWQGGLDDQTDASKAAASKMAKDLADETEAYKDALLKRNAAFAESMANLIWAHQDKVKTLEKQITDENETFATKMGEQVRTYQEAMGQMEADHKKTLDSLQSDLTTETTDHQKKVDQIQSLIDKEESYGKNARQSKLTDLRLQLQTEVDAYSKKSGEIQKKVDEENTAYKISVDKKTADEARATLALESEHDKQLSNYQTELKQEQDILNAHQSEVDAVKNKARLDDIALLQQQHAAENAEALKQHNKKMADIVSQGSAEGGAGGAAFSAPMNEALNKLKANFGDKAQGMGNNLVAGVEAGAKEAASKMVTDFINGVIDKAKQAVSFMGKVGVASSSLLTAVAPLAGLPHFAGGVSNFSGGLAIVGEKGPELVSLPSGSSVMPSNQGYGNVYVEHLEVREQSDIQSIGAEIGFRLALLPK